MRWVGYLVNSILLGMLVTSYAAPYLSPYEFWPPALFGLIFPVVVAINVLFLLIWIVNKDKFWRFSLVCLLPAIFFFPRFLQLSGTDIALEKVNKDAVRILTWNVRIFNKNQPQARFEGRDEMLKLIAEQNPDIVCLQEFYRLAGDDTDDHLHRISELTGLPYRQFHTAFRDKSGRYQWGLAVFSRYPLLESRKIRFEEGGSLNACMFVDVEMPSRRVRLFNTHLQSIRLSDADFEFVDAIAGIKENRSTKATLGKFRNAYRIRAKQADQLAEEISHSDWPVICVGDFNDTPMSYAYRRISGDLRDAFQTAGSGSGRTHANIPFLRIDYMLFDKVFELENSTTIRTNLSDHYPVITDFVLENM